MRASDRKRAGSFELICWSFSSVLLGLYASGTLYFFRSQDRAVATFRSLQTQSVLSPASTVAVRELVEAGVGKSLQVRAPDTTVWSASRLDAYETAQSAGVPHAVLRIRALDLEVPVYLGATEWNMNRGAAWVEGTAPIGSSGNTGLAAHRDGFFRPLGRIRVGDDISIETLGSQFHYRVTQIKIVAPEAVEELASTAGSTLTLVTCYPFYFVGPAPQRFIVRAELAADQAGNGPTASSTSASTLEFPP
jgi:sortase A